jgi:hypothetical protein
MKYIFFRNDDVRDKLDDSMVHITELFIKNNVPISHAVEPANVSPEVVRWLIEMKKEHPNLIEIVQHGYSHFINVIINKKSKTIKGEFGGVRGYTEQFEEIKKGKEMMSSFFSTYWFPLFTFPFGRRNVDALYAVRDNGFLATNGNIRLSIKHKLLYLLARTFKQPMILDKVVSWNLKNIPKVNLFQLDIGISFIKSYNDDTAVFHSFDYLKTKTLKVLQNTNAVGVVLHHRYHGNNEINLLDEYVQWLKSLDNVKCVSQEYLYNKFSNKIKR